MVHDNAIKVCQLVDSDRHKTFIASSQRRGYLWPFLSAGLNTHWYPLTGFFLAVPKFVTSIKSCLIVAPKGEYAIKRSIILLSAESGAYIGIVLSAVLYGLYIGIYCMSIRIIFARATITRLQRILYTLYGSVLLILNTFTFLSMPQVGRMMWIPGRSYPGGPVVYYNMEYIYTSYAKIGNASQNIAILMSDAFLVYRCYVIFGSRVQVIVFPILSTLASFALSMATIPAADDLSIPLSNRLSAAGIALTTLTNIIVTGMISFKILLMNYRIKDHIDIHERRKYTNAAAILVESAAPCAILGIFISIIIPMSDTPWYTAVFLVWAMTVALTPQLIILRIAKGVAWTNETSGKISRVATNMDFASSEGSDANASDQNKSQRPYNIVDERIMNDGERDGHPNAKTRPCTPGIV